MDALIEVLKSAILEAGDSSEVEHMSRILKTEYENALKRAGFDLSKIHTTSDGRLKVSTPIQICRKKRIDVYEALYKYYYPNDIDSFSAIYAEWLDYYTLIVRQGHRQPATLRRHKYFYKKYIEDTWFDELSVSKMKKSDVKRFYREVTADKQMTATTFGNIKSLVNAVMQYAETEKDLDVVSTYRIDTKDLAMKEVDNSENVFSQSEHDALMTVAWSKIQDSVYARAISVMGRLDCRIGELSGLHWSDIDFDNRTVRISRQLVWYGSEYIERSPKGNAKYSKRILPLTPQTIEVLKLQRRISPFSEHVFVRDDGSGLPIKEKHFNKALERYCSQAGIKYRSSHKLRFYAVTRGLECGEDIETMRAMSGHSTIRMTEHYDRRSEIRPAISPEEWAFIVDVPNRTKVAEK